VVGVILGLAVALVLIAVGRQPLVAVWGHLRGEPFYAGWPASHWRQLLGGGPGEQAEALETLEGAGSAGAPVLAAVLQDQRRASAEVRCLAAELLGKVGSGADAAATSLVAALQDPDPYVRSVASAAVPKANVPARVGVPALVELLGREQNPVHVRALSEYRSEAEPGLAVLLQIMKNPDVDTETRWNAIRAIGKIGAAAASAVPALVAALQDPAATIREHSAEALGDIGPPAAEAAQPLASVLHDPAPRVRRDAVRSLGQIGPSARAVLSDIQAALQDQEEIVRQAARNTLQALAPETVAEPVKTAASGAK